MAETYDADVIVVGSGVLGSNAAYELAKAGKSVILMEAGLRIPRWKIVQNSRNSSRRSDYNRPYPDVEWARTTESDEYLENTGSFALRPGMLKLVGGTTWHWAAATWRYLPSDMKMKSTYGVGRDWPISYDDLEPWYQRAEEALGVVGSDEQDQSGQGGPAYPPRSKPYPLPPEGKTYMFQRLEARLEPLGFNFIHEPNARVTKPYDAARPAPATTTACRSARSARCIRAASTPTMPRRPVPSCSPTPPRTSWKRARAARSSRSITRPRRARTYA